MILYYSGTGNSRYAAAIIASQTGDELICMNDIMRRRALHENTAQYSFSSDRPFVFVCPTYCWRMPRVVEKFIRESRFSGNMRAYFFLTCGGSTGAAAKHAEKFCSEMGFEFMGLGSVVMPENYIAMFDSPSYDDAQGIIRSAVSVIESAGRYINFCRPIEDANGGSGIKALPTKFNSAFYKFFVTDKKYRVTEDCVGCGSCVKICPMANITLKDMTPDWGGNCTQCMACISICPRNAIEYGRISIGKRRYYLRADGTQLKKD